MSRVHASTLDDLQKLMALPDVAIYINNQWQALTPDPHLLDDLEVDIDIAQLIILAAFGGISGACQLATEKKAHLLALSRKDNDILRVLLERPTVDNRHVVYTNWLRSKFLV
jgi:hypothetical protein